MAALVKEEEERLKLLTEVKFIGFEKAPIGTQNEKERELRNESMKRMKYHRE